MTLDIHSAAAYTIDPSLTRGTGPLEVDCSITRELIENLIPREPPGTVNGRICYNRAVPLTFDYYPSANTRPRFDKSYIIIKYIAGNTVNGGDDASMIKLDPTLVSIPWNTIVATIQEATFRVGPSAVEVERLPANFQHGNMVKMLMNYSRQGLETATDRFFTPCIESARDYGDTMSDESNARAAKAFVGKNGPIAGSKLIMLADLFDCCRGDICWYSKQYRIQITMNDPSSVLFGLYGHQQSQFFVTSIEMRVFSEELTREVVEEEAKTIEDGGTMMKQMYLNYEVQIETHSTNKTYMNQFVNNMIGAVLLFPSTGAMDGVSKDGFISANPYQYTYAEDADHANGISAFQHIWKNIQVPQTSLMVSSNYSDNADLFYLYRIMANNFHDIQLGCSLDQLTNMGRIPEETNGVVYDNNNYVMFPAAFNNLTGNLYVDSQMALHRITTSGGATGATAVIVRIRVNAVEILANQVVNRMT